MTILFKEITMKLVFILALSFLSTAAMAFSEIRCSGGQADLDLDFWGTPNSSARATLTLRQNGTTRVDNFTMFTRNFGRQYTLIFSGAGNNLEIDTWPDRGMRPLRSYPARFRGMRSGSMNMRCTYWN